MVHDPPDTLTFESFFVAEFPRLVSTLTASPDVASGDGELWAQNGDPATAGIVDNLDGWNREDVSFTFDFDVDGYLPVPDDDRDAALATVQAMVDAGLTVTTTDYLPEDAPDLPAEAVERPCGAGAIPFVSDIDLTRVPDRPLTC